MERIFRSTVLLLMLIVLPTSGFAAMPDITAGETYFSNGCYVLKNNVKVVARGRTMTAHEAKVSLTSQKVWARGDVTLIQDGIEFKCDSIYVQGADKTVDVLGNVNFNQDGLLSITSDVAKFSWGTKVADFYGKVSLTIIDAEQLNFAVGLDRSIDFSRTYDHVQYNVVDQTLLLIENRVSTTPKVDMPQLRIEID